MKSSLYDKYGVDLVLTAHNHNYARSLKLHNEKVVQDDKKGTVYVVSVSGPKMSKLGGEKIKHLMAKMGTDVQLFQVISIDGGNLSYKCYTAKGSLYDSFKINK